MSVKAKTSCGVGFFGLLGLLFIGLKLGHVIDCSWWLVLIPLYAPLALGIIAVLLIVVWLCFQRDDNIFD